MTDRAIGGLARYRDATLEMLLRGAAELNDDPVLLETLRGHWILRVPSGMETTKLERKQRDRLNFVAKHVPGRGRILELYRLAMELELMDEGMCTGRTELECPTDHESYRRDALYLRRLAYDLEGLRTAVRGDLDGRGNRRYHVKEDRP